MARTGRQQIVSNAVALAVLAWAGTPRADAGSYAMPQDVYVSPRAMEAISADITAGRPADAVERIEGLFADPSAQLVKIDEQQVMSIRDWVDRQLTDTIFPTRFREQYERVAGQAAQPVLGSGRAGVAEDRGTPCHTFPERVREAGQRLLVDAECPQSGPGEGQRDPTVGFVHGGLGVRGRGHLLQQFGEPGPSARRGVEGQELVAPGDGRCAGQQDVLDVVELEHGRYCIWSSMVEKADLRRRAFLISSAVT